MFVLQFLDALLLFGVVDVGATDIFRQAVLEGFQFLQETLIEIGALRKGGRVGLLFHDLQNLFVVFLQLPDGRVIFYVQSCVSFVEVHVEDAIFGLSVRGHLADKQAVPDIQG